MLSVFQRWKKKSFHCFADIFNNTGVTYPAAESCLLLPALLIIHTAHVC